MSNLVIVESPAKESTIKGYLGSNYKVIASKGHIRDLPKSGLGVDIENDFTPHYINIRGKGDVISQLKQEAKAAGKIFLATDPDREGEAISWHLASALGIPLDRLCRVTFNEITKSAVKEAIKHPSLINQDLVNSQQTRRILDRILGYQLSPFLWKNVRSGLSAGRVQSVATRIISEREDEIRSFNPQEYWTVEVSLATEDGAPVAAHYVGKAGKECRLTDEASANAVLEAIKQNPFVLTGIRQSQKSRLPSPPFTTSTLQQEASKKLGFQSKRIMKTAQELYEGINLGSELGGFSGLITYMRTDSLRISATAQEAAFELIDEQYGKTYHPSAPRQFKMKPGAQDAHEAIRPSDVRLTPDKIKKCLTLDQYRLYRLIWERFVASQMSAATFSLLSLDFTCGEYQFRASGSTLKFKGYLAVYDDSSDHEDGTEKTGLPSASCFTEGSAMPVVSSGASQHFTEPPPRYTEASLIKFLEDNGIGRPSTYTAIISTIMDRNYVRREGKSLVPTPLGEVTTGLMKTNFPDIVDYQFTADMEDKFDRIARGEETPLAVLTEFYTGFSDALTRARENVKAESVEIPPEESDVICEKCGRRMVYKTGRFGRFLACPGYPECKNTKPLGKDGKPIEKKPAETEVADFKCELCGGDMVLRSGRYGSFYACANYPTCKFTRQKVNELGVACPKCSAKIITKIGKGKLFYSCERFPDCDFSTWDLPLEETCPVCGDMLLYKRTRKVVYCRNKQCEYKKEDVER